MNNTVPWPKPISHYDTDGPRDPDSPPVEFEVGGVKFRVASTSDLALSTMRTRFHVKCLTCNKTLHEATTGPTNQIEAHLKLDHGFVGKLEHDQ